MKSIKSIGRPNAIGAGHNEHQDDDDERDVVHRSRAAKQNSPPTVGRISNYSSTDHSLDPDYAMMSG